MDKAVRSKVVISDTHALSASKRAPLMMVPMFCWMKAVIQSLTSCWLLLWLVSSSWMVSRCSFSPQSLMMVVRFISTVAVSLPSGTMTSIILPVWGWAFSAQIFCQPELSILLAASASCLLRTRRASVNPTPTSTLLTFTFRACGVEWSSRRRGASTRSTGNSTVFSVSQQSSPSLRRKQQTPLIFSTSAATFSPPSLLPAVKLSLSRLRVTQLLVSGCSLLLRWAALDSQSDSHWRKVNSCPPQSSTLSWARVKLLRWNWTASVGLRTNSLALNSSRLRFFCSICFSMSSCLPVRSSHSSSSCSASTTSKHSYSYMPQSPPTVCFRKCWLNILTSGTELRHSDTASESTEQLAETQDERTSKWALRLSESRLATLRNPYSSSCPSESSSGFSSHSLSAWCRKQALTLQSTAAVCCCRSPLATTLQLLSSTSTTRREGLRTREWAVGSKAKSGRQSRKSCPPLRLMRVSAGSPSSMEPLRCVRICLEWVWIWWKTADTFWQVDSIQGRCRSRQARLLACRQMVRLSKTSTVALRCSSSMTPVRLMFFLNWNFLSPLPSSTFCRTNTPTLSCSFSTSRKNSSGCRLLGSFPTQSLRSASLPSSRIRAESAMPAQCEVLGQIEVSNWFLNWPRRTSMGCASPRAMALSLTSCWHPPLRKQKVWKQAAARSILTSNSPASTSRTLWGRAFSLAGFVVCSNSRSMQHSLAARLR